MNFEDVSEQGRLLSPSVKRGVMPDFSRHPSRLSALFSKRRIVASIGFRPKNSVLHRAWNIAVSLVILICVLPIFAILIPLVLILNGRPVFYAGERIGKDGRPFNLYKFRTLKTDVEKTIGASVVAVDSELVTPIGKILRDTRLDELPQLVNVLRGDMNLIGPRPVRRVICEENRKTIKNYNIRFRVKPGLLGHTQIFCPHGTSKAIRARYNNILINRDTSILGEASLVIFSALTSLKLLASHIQKWVKSANSGANVGAKSNRMMAFLPMKANFEGVGAGGNSPVTVEMTNSKNLTIVSRYPLEQRQISGHVFVQKPKGGTVRVRISADVQKLLLRQVGRSEPYSYDATYQTNSDFGRFMIDRHVLLLAFAK